MILIAINRPLGTIEILTHSTNLKIQNPSLHHIQFVKIQLETQVTCCNSSAILGSDLGDPSSIRCYQARAQFK